MRVLLTHIPSGQSVAEQLSATYERLEARQAGRVARGRIDFLGIEGLQFDPFVDAGYHAFGEGRALELYLHLFLPRRVVNRGEVGAKPEFFGNRNHDNLLIISTAASLAMYSVPRRAARDGRKMLNAN